MIVLQDVSKSFDGGLTFAVRRVSLEVQASETLILLGSSGCGKTTTLKMINRLVEPTSGKIEVDGVNVLERDPVELRRSIGYVFQGIGLFPHMTIQENVAVIPKLLGWSPEKQVRRAQELLELVRLAPGDFAHRYPHELSGGQKQRVGVARALAADPDYLLMDEPFGALDPITREQIQEEFAQLEAIQQKTIVFVTHDVFEAVALGERIAIMEAGEIMQLGPPMELLTQPANDFVRDFLGKHRFQLQFNAVPVERFVRCYDANTHANLPPIFETTTVNQPASDVLARLGNQIQESALVIDGQGKFLGVIPRQALLERPNTAIAMLAAEHAVSVNSAENLGKAVEIMRRQQVSDLPVVEGEGKLVGVLQSRDLADALIGKPVNPPSPSSHAES